MVTNHQVYEFVMEVAAGELDEIAGIASRIKGGSQPW